MNEKEAENFLDSLPDDDLLDFDPFLVGNGNLEKYDEYLHQGYSRKFQLSGVSSFKDLVESSSTEEFINDFPEKEIEEYPYESYFKTFLEMKKHWYDLMDFTSVKSETFRIPVSEENVILNDTDKYLIKYLQENNFGFNSAYNLSQLSAFIDMKIETVKLGRLCDCPLCYCTEGTVINTRKLSDLISSRSSIYSCRYLISPVIYERSSIRFSTVSDFTLGRIKLSDVPREFSSDLIKLCDQLKEVDIRFTDLRSLEGWSDEVVIDSGKYLLVHNGYVENRSPLDFLREWVNPIKFDLDDSDNDQVFYVKGRPVKMLNGFYVDMSTGEVM